MNGAGLQLIFANKIQNAGQPLTATRPAATQGGTPTTSTVYFLPQPLNAQNANAMLLEAGFNAGEGNPYDFVCAGNADVKENDYITYDGFQWRVMNTNPQVLSGTPVSLHCYAQRQKAV